MTALSRLAAWLRELYIRQAIDWEVMRGRHGSARHWELIHRLERVVEAGR